MWRCFASLPFHFWSILNWGRSRSSASLGKRGKTLKACNMLPFAGAEHTKMMWNKKEKDHYSEIVALTGKTLVCMLLTDAHTFPTTLLQKPILLRVSPGKPPMQQHVCEIFHHHFSTLFFIQMIEKLFSTQFSFNLSMNSRSIMFLAKWSK